MSVKKADSFGEFLDVVQGRSEVPQAIDVDRLDEGQIDETRKILAAIPAGQSTPVQTVFEATDVPLTTFAESLKQLQEAGLVSLTGSRDDEMVGLSPAGAKLLALSPE